MDCQMPVLDGYDATRALRKSTSTEVRRVLVVAMTASAIRGDREKCLAVGMNEFLCKPLRSRTLEQMLDMFLLPRSADNGDGGGVVAGAEA